MPTSSFARFAVFSDVHANLPALQTFLGMADQENYDRLFCLGDVVGYGAHPSECCELLRMYAPPVQTVLGNHDWVALHPEEGVAFNEIAREAIHWTGKNLTPEAREYLSNLPYLIEEDDFAFVHSSFIHPEKWNYVITRDDAMENFRRTNRWISFIGHSHHPFVAELHPEGIITSPHPTGDIMLRRDRRYIVNVGSVGQPRDHNPKLCYVSVDLDSSLLRFHRAAYPIFEAQQAIADAGLPMELADRLGLGW